MTGTSGRAALALGNSSRPLIPRHVDVGQDEDQRHACCIGDALKGGRCRLGKFHVEATSAEIAPELLPEQQLNIGFVIHDKNKKAHARPPDLAMVAAARGRMILNSVNVPGSVSTSKRPACCLTTMS